MVGIDMENNDLKNIFNGIFTSSSVERMESDFSPLPKGEYLVIIDRPELKANKSGTGTNLNLKLAVECGKYTNRIIFDNMCITNPSEFAERIAQTKLAQICDALGIGDLHSSNQLYGGRLLAAIDVELDRYATEKYGNTTYRNTVKRYLPLVRVSVDPLPVAVNKPARAKAVATLKALDDDFNDDVPF
jgi:hypothetical protein